MEDADNNEQMPVLDEFMSARGWRRRSRGSGWETGRRWRPARTIRAADATFTLTVGGMSFFLRDEAAVRDFLTQAELSADSERPSPL